MVKVSILTRCSFLCLLAFIHISSAREATTTSEYVLSTLLDYLEGAPKPATDNTHYSSCDILISSDLGKFSPVLIYPETTRLIRAQDDNGHLHFDVGATVQIECPGQGNFVIGQDDKRDVVAKCEGGTKFSVNGDSVHMKKLLCKKWPEHVIYRNGTCLYGKTLYKTAFNISTGLVPLYESCVDTRKRTTVYTKYILTKDALGAQTGVKRPSWKDKFLFKNSHDANNFYKRASQLRSFEQLLGSKTLAEKYIKSTSDYFLSKGHLMAKSDNLHGAAQISTFWHSNAAPQWQTFNGGNWNALENAVRKLAAAKQTDLICYTGTFGIATLPDINGKNVDLFLDADDRTMPVPLLFFKVLYEPISQAGIAIAGFNNPYDTIETVLGNVRCRDICESITWVTWKTHELNKGYTFCCEVNDFRENYPEVLPEFPVGSILR